MTIQIELKNLDKFVNELNQLKADIDEAIEEALLKLIDKNGN